MSTVDIDSRAWRIINSKLYQTVDSWQRIADPTEQNKMITDITNGTYEMINAEIRTTLKAELLAKIPKQKDAFGEQMYPGKHDFDNQLKYGYNQAITEITKIIEEVK